MLQSKLFGKTLKQAPREEVSVNARLLIRAGFVDKLMSGVYTYLPLGLRVLNKIKTIVREEMDKIDGQEILMPALLPKENWEKTGRWTDPGKDVMFQLEGRGGKQFGLGWTHEEIVTPLVQHYVESYKDLPVAVYQIQDKFRNEPRAKSGLMRGIEFSMKDLYSFHRDEADMWAYYEKAKQAYLNVFHRCGLDARIVEASGGAFSKYSHEFQVFTEYGEDTVRHCDKCDFAQNTEICEVKLGDKCPKCGQGEVQESKAIEVGNIFPLKTKYSAAFNFKYTDETGKQQDVVMGCFGIGPSRVMGTIAEIYHDDAGIRWPMSVAPFRAHLLSLGKGDKIRAAALALYGLLTSAGVETLFDDRDVSAGTKFNDSDLIGIPYRVVLSEKTLEKGCAEVKMREKEGVEFMKLEEIVKLLNS